MELLEHRDAHPRRPRCAYTGELVQMDASPHIWFCTEVTHLHLAIDDATGKILGTYFDTQETLNAYYQITHQILTSDGNPAKFLTNRRTVFEYKRKNASSDEEDMFTQFSYACHQLGIELEATSVPQAKGSGRGPNKAITKLLEHQKNKKNHPDIPQGKQSVKQLAKQGQGMTSIEIID